MSDLTTSFHAFAQPLKSKVTQLTEKSLLYQHYPTLKKATNSELGDTPGYVYEELVQLTYSDLTMATQLAIYLADCLDTNGVKIRSAKTLHHLIRMGSRQFRKTLRTEKDDVLRKAANSSDPLVAKIIADSRKNLFDEELISKDDLASDEILPQPTLSGMGGSSGSKGFGNTPISKENIGHKVLEIIDKAVNITDQRDEVMKMCLANSEVGDYQPVEVQGQPLTSTMQTSQTMKTSQRSLGTSFMAGKKHVPGRAGGGWESSEDENYDEPTNQLEQSMSEVSLSSPIKKDIMLDSACEALEDDESTESIPQFRIYCSLEIMPTLAEVNDCYNMCQEVDTLIVLDQIKVILEDTKSNMRATRAMLVLECYLRSGKVKPEIVKSMFCDVLTTFHQNCDAIEAAIKAKKLVLTITTMNKNKSLKT